MNDAAIIEPFLHFQDGLLGRLQNSIEPADNRHWENHIATFASKNEVRDPLSCPFSIAPQNSLTTVLFTLEPTIRARRADANTVCLIRIRIPLSAAPRQTF